MKQEHFPSEVLWHLNSTARINIFYSVLLYHLKKIVVCFTMPNMSAEVSCGQSRATCQPVWRVTQTSGNIDLGNQYVLNQPQVL